MESRFGKIYSIFYADVPIHNCQILGCAFQCMLFLLAFYKLPLCVGLSLMPACIVCSSAPIYCDRPQLLWIRSLVCVIVTVPHGCQVQSFPDIGRIPNVSHSIISIVYPIQTLALPWNFLCLIFLPCLLLPLAFHKQLFIGYQLTDILYSWMFQVFSRTVLMLTRTKLPSF